jgi:hypothetical protein
MSTFRCDGHLELYSNHFAELSYEDGLRLIEETYSAERMDCSFDDMETDEDEMCLIPVEIDQDSDDMGNQTTPNCQMDVRTGDPIYQAQQHCCASGDLPKTEEIITDVNISETRKFLQVAQHELQMLRSIRQEMEPHHDGQLENYPTPPQTPE